MAESEDQNDVEQTHVKTPQERAESRATTVRLLGTIVELARLIWEVGTHQW